METTTNRKDFVTWNITCYQCKEEYENYSWSCDDIPMPFCSEECHVEYYSIENRRDRKIKIVLNEI